MYSLNTVITQRVDLSPHQLESTHRGPLPDDIRQRCDAAMDDSKPASANEMEHCVHDRNQSSHRIGVVLLASEIAQRTSDYRKSIWRPGSVYITGSRRNGSSSGLHFLCYRDFDTTWLTVLLSRLAVGVAEWNPREERLVLNTSKFIVTFASSCRLGLFHL